ncbi:hypothetical protein [Absidia glauca]|uniref:Prefoldin subunit 5 n=1 Tax=Absidia glauca TaxID=4829 RepID=A0A168M4P2_ABSGL|nr:hypothetical protein [Absidia glauca]
MAETQQVNLSDLDLSSLQNVKNQLEEELNHLTQSYSKLKGVQGRFTDCADSVNSLKGEQPDEKQILVIVDIGTGYYVEKSVGDASNFYTEKVEYVKKNLATLEENINGKQNNLRAIVNVMQDKLQEQQQAAKK